MRKIIHSDIPQLLSIELATQFAPWSVDVFKRCLDIGYDGWVMEQEGKIVGFIIISFSSFGESHILNLCVDPPYQRQGLGCALLTYALAQAESRQAGIVYLEVRRSNHKAIQLYHKMDFIQIGERKNYYPASKGYEDALIFAKDLQWINSAGVDHPSLFKER